MAYSIAPWTTDVPGDEDWHYETGHVIVRQDGFPRLGPIIAYVVPITGPEDREFNANLIAAGPDMLEALLAVAAKIPMQDRYIEDMVFAALAKAQGQME